MSSIIAVSGYFQLIIIATSDNETPLVTVCLSLWFERTNK